MDKCNGPWRLIKEVRDFFREKLIKEVARIKNEEEISEKLEIEILQGEYLFSGNGESYGMGFIIRYKEEIFNYQEKGAGGYGGCGNAIFINKIDAHNDIDKANAELLKYHNTDEWNDIIKSTAKSIIEEVKNKVLPQLDN